MVKLGQMERVPGFRHCNVSTVNRRSGQDWFLMGKGFGVWACCREQTGEGRSHCFQWIAETSIGVKVDSRFAVTTMVG